MSRIKLTPKNPEHEVVAGLDRPLNTFFISVTRIQDEDDLEDEMPIEFKHRWHRDDVIAKIESYAEPCEKRDAVVRAIMLDTDPATYLKDKNIEG